jgi:uncharacterized HAD superfamily protein
MNIGIDIDGVLLDTETAFRTVAELYNTIDLNNKPVRDYEEPRVQERYNWTEKEIQEFADKYFLEVSKKANFMPYVKEVLDLLKKEGHKLVIITARGMDKAEMRAVVEKKFDEEGLKFDKYYWAQREKADICVNEKIDIMIDDNYNNCISIANKNIKTLYFREAEIKKINNKNIIEVHNWGEIYKYIKMYNSEINN